MKLRFWIFAIACYLTSFIVGWASLPSELASHFDGSGAPDAWSSKPAYLGFMAVIGLVMLGGMPLTSRLPVSLMNLPNTDYWSAPERVATLRTKLTGEVRVFAGLTGLLLSAVQFMIIAAHISAPSAPRLGLWPWVAVALYLVGTVVFVRDLRRSYATPG